VGMPNRVCAGSQALASRLVSIYFHMSNVCAESRYSPSTPAQLMKNNT
jgi:hypothetical protein